MKYQPKFEVSQWKDTIETMGWDYWAIEEPNGKPTGITGEVMEDIQKFIKENCVQTPLSYSRQWDDIGIFKEGMRDTEWGYETDDEYVAIQGPTEGPLKEYAIFLAEYLDDSYAYDF